MVFDDLTPTLCLSLQCLVMVSALISTPHSGQGRMLVVFGLADSATLRYNRKLMIFCPFLPPVEYPFHDLQKNSLLGIVMNNCYFLLK